MVAILEHFYVFGTDELQAELEGLIGTLGISSKSDGASSSPTKKIFQDLAILAMAGLGFLTAVDRGLSSVISITEDTRRLIEIIEEDEIPS